MTGRRGQVAPYLVLALVAICVLTLMNVGVFLTVSAKNRAMNAGDAASVAVAKYQGDLLNKIGELNVERLRLVFDANASVEEKIGKSAELEMKQMRICFLDPLEGIRIGNEAARARGIEEDPDAEMRKILKDHVSDILSVFVNTPELYPEPWEGAWEEYAQLLDQQVNNGIVAGPDNPEFADMYVCDPMFNRAFYNAIAGRQWCWFKFNGMWMLDCCSANMPRPDVTEPTVRWNCEIYPLHLAFRPINGLDGELVGMIRTLTGYDEKQIRKVWNRDVAKCAELRNRKWAFYDSVWSKWSVSRSSVRVGFNPNDFPIVGEVRPEYDVEGCAAKCRVITRAADVLHEGGEDQQVVFTSAAKPFGTVTDSDGGVAPVTAYRNLVTPAFNDARLVAYDSVGDRLLSDGADAEWAEHVRKHVPEYFVSGPNAINGCWYCQQLVKWEHPSLRRSAATWLKYHGDECEVCGTGTSGQGGTAHAH